MRVVRIFIALIGLFGGNYVFAHVSQQSMDSVSLSDLVNQKIKQNRSSRSPILKSSLFIDGKKTKSRFTTYLLINNKLIQRSKHKSFELDTSYFKVGDSLTIYIKYRDLEIHSGNMSARLFLHGGEFVSGIVSNYNKEKRDFETDIDSYLSKNQDNKLYSVLYQTTKIDEDYLKKDNKLYYGILISYITPLIRYNFKFQ